MATVKEVRERKKKLGLPIEEKEQPPKEERQKEGSDYIKQREKLAAQRNITSKAAAAILASQVPETPESIAEKKQLQQAADLQLAQAAILGNKERLAPELERIGELPPEEEEEKAKAGGMLEDQKARLENVRESAAGQFLTQLGIMGLPATPSAVGGSAVAGGALPYLRQVSDNVLKNVAAAKKLIGIGGILSIGRVSFTMRQKVREAANVFQNSNTNLNNIIAAVKLGDPNYPPEQAIDDWNTELMNIRKSKRALKSLTDNWAEAWISGGKDELDDIYAFEDNLARKQLFFEQALIGQAQNLNTDTMEEET